MRLIDADTSIESIRNLLGNGHTLEQAIDAQPTAYDVDKVIEQLNDRSVLARPVGWTKSYEILTMDDAVEIVKGGGVNAT